MKTPILNAIIAVIVGILVLGPAVEHYWPIRIRREPVKEIINPMQWALAQHLRTPPQPGELEAYQQDMKKKLEMLNWAAGDVERMMAGSTDEDVLKLGREFQRSLPKRRSQFQRVIDGDFSDKAACDAAGADSWNYYWERMTEKTKQGGMTIKNYHKIKDGMAPWEVDAILGCSGIEQSSAGSLKTYTWHEGRAQVVASFEDGKLVAKSQFGL